MKLVLYLAFFSYTCLYGDIIFENGKVTEIIDSTTFEYEFNYSVFEDRFRFGWRFVSDDPIPSPNRFKLKIKIACIKPSKEEGSQDIEGKEYLSKMILYKELFSAEYLRGPDSNGFHYADLFIQRNEKNEYIHKKLSLELIERGFAKPYETCYTCAPPPFTNPKMAKNKNPAIYKYAFFYRDDSLKKMRRLCGKNVPDKCK
jgi:hypothetical protein